jgi:hypothetical protein
MFVGGVGTTNETVSTMDKSETTVARVPKSESEIVGVGDDAVADADFSQ